MPEEVNIRMITTLDGVYFHRDDLIKWVGQVKNVTNDQKAILFELTQHLHKMGEPK